MDTRNYWYETVIVSSNTAPRNVFNLYSRNDIPTENLGTIKGVLKFICQMERESNQDLGYMLSHTIFVDCIQRNKEHENFRVVAKDIGTGHTLEADYDSKSQKLINMISSS